MTLEKIQTSLYSYLLSVVRVQRLVQVRLVNETRFYSSGPPRFHPKSKGNLREGFSARKCDAQGHVYLYLQELKFLSLIHISEPTRLS